jgi:hypothetical protein
MDSGYEPGSIFRCGRTGWWSVWIGIRAIDRCFISWAMKDVTGVNGHQTSFIKGMKDVTVVKGASNVVHQGYERRYGSKRSIERRSSGQ